VLIVAESEGDGFRLVRELKRAGYDPRYDRVDDAAALLVLLKEGRAWDVVITDGTSCLSLLRDHDADLPVVFITVPLDEDLAVEAMRAGARDYVLKGNLRRLGPLIEREVRDAAMRRDQRRTQAAPGGT